MHQDQRYGAVTPTRNCAGPVLECLLQRYGLAVTCHGAGALVAADLGGAVCGIVLLEEVAFSASIELPSRQPTNWRTDIPKKCSPCCKSYRPTTDFPTWGSGKRTENPQGNRLLEGTTKTCAHQDPGERSSDPKKTEPGLPGSVRESPAEVRVDNGLLRVREPWCAGISPFEGGHHYPYLRPNYRDGTQPHPLAENWIKDLLSMALPTKSRPSFTHSQSLPPRSFHKPLILLHQRADGMKTTITEN